VLTGIVCYDVAARYIFRAPTSWAFDGAYILYGTLFMMAGAYTLSRNGHVRGDVLYGFFPPRVQAGVDLALYFLFFLPGIAALAYSGIEFAQFSWQLREHSSTMAGGPPLYHFKTLIPIAGAPGWLDPGAGGGGSLHGLPPHRQLAPTPPRRGGGGPGGDQEAGEGRSHPSRLRAPRAGLGRGHHLKGMTIGLVSLAVVVGLIFLVFLRVEHISSGHVGLLMLALIVAAIMLGFPTAFTLMGLGMLFGYYAFYEKGAQLHDNRIFDLMVQRTYGVMTNDVLISIPLFVFMGYIIERANVIDRLFKSIQLAAGAIPGSLAVATVVTCAIFATATGIVGAVVTLMGLLAFPAMLRAGYDLKLSAGAVTAGGCLGILIPPSIMLILYGATAGVSVVKLYAGAFFPGLMLAGLYVLYIIARAVLNPKLAPRLPSDETKISVGTKFRMLLTSFFPWRC
jgi:hypothetical protein